MEGNQVTGTHDGTGVMKVVGGEEEDDIEGEGDDAQEDAVSTEGSQEPTGIGEEIKEEKVIAPEDYLSVIAKLESVDDIIGKMDERSAALGKTVQGLIDLLVFSQGEISDLKRENAELRMTVGKLATEDKRTQFKVNLAEEKLDRIETLTKKKNLIFEEHHGSIVPKLDCFILHKQGLSTQNALRRIT